MPFLKIEKKPSGTYLRIVESYRDDTGKSSHRILHSLGKVSDYTPEQLRAIGLKLYELGGGEVKSILQGSIEEIGRYNYGYGMVYKKAMQYYQLDAILDRIKRKSKLTYAFADAVFLMLIERLQDPCSKRQNYIHQLDYIGIDTVYLQHLYRALNHLDKNSKIIQKQIYQTGRDLFNQALDVVFYDVTTLYFESSEESELDNRKLRKKGFSKDGKVGDTQILLAMMIDREKNPIGYYIFEGNVYEGHTLKNAIEELKKEYSIDKVIIVADRGMMNKENIAVVKESGYEFIVGDRLKNMPKKIQEHILTKSNYKQQWIYTDNEGEEVLIKYTTIEYDGRTIIGTYSEKRAKKDKYDRDVLVEKAKKLAKKPELLEKKAKRFFLKKDNEDIATSTYSIDEDKIKNAARFDGFLAIATNNGTLPTIEILDQYKQLFKIEHCFRTFKSHLETRPMFHWTDTRIRGHICLCYMAYTLQHWVMKKLKDMPIQITEKILRDMLSKMQLSLINNNNDRVYIKSTPHMHERKLIDLIGLKPLPAMFKKKLGSSYL